MRNPLSNWSDWFALPLISDILFALFTLWIASACFVIPVTPVVPCCSILFPSPQVVANKIARGPSTLWATEEGRQTNRESSKRHEINEVLILVWRDITRCYFELWHVLKSWYIRIVYHGISPLWGNTKLQGTNSKRWGILTGLANFKQLSLGQRTKTSRIVCLPNILPTWFAPSCKSIFKIVGLHATYCYFLLRIAFAFQLLSQTATSFMLRRLQLASWCYALDMCFPLQNSPAWSHELWLWHHGCDGNAFWSSYIP